MRKLFITLIYGSIFTMVIANANAQTDKSKYCPSIHQIKYSFLKPSDDRSLRYYVLRAYNQDGKYFVSDILKHDGFQGPVHPVIFNEVATTYNPTEKTLTCVYYAYDHNYPDPQIINYGDY